MVFPSIIAHFAVFYKKIKGGAAKNFAAPPVNPSVFRQNRTPCARTAVRKSQFFSDAVSWRTLLIRISSLTEETSLIPRTLTFLPLRKRMRSVPLRKVPPLPARSCISPKEAISDKGYRTSRYTRSRVLAQDQDLRRPRDKDSEDKSDWPETPVCTPQKANKARQSTPPPLTASYRRCTRS